MQKGTKVRLRKSEREVVCLYIEEVAYVFVYNLKVNNNKPCVNNLMKIREHICLANQTGIQTIFQMNDVCYWLARATERLSVC